MDSSSSDVNNSFAQESDDGVSPCKRPRLTLSPDAEGDGECNNGKKGDPTYLVYSLSTATSDTQEYALDDSLKERKVEITITPDTLEDDTINEPILDCLNRDIKGDFTFTDKNKNIPNSLGETLQQHLEHKSSNNEKNKVVPCALKTSPSLVRDAKIISSVVPNANYNVIYNKLLENRNNQNRLDLVTSKLLEANESNENDLPAATYNKPTLFDDVDVVMKRFPTADADLVWAFLESLKDDPNRIQITIIEMGLKKEESTILENEIKPIISQKNSSIIDDPALENDPLFKDMRTVAKLFPDHDRNEIYALLEANVDKNSRLQIVINELLRIVPTKHEDHKGNPLESVEFISNDLPAKESPVLIDLSEDLLQQDTEHLQLLFPDCDPNYLYDKLEGMKDVPDRRMLLAGELTDKKDYPKLKDRLEKEQREREKTKQYKRSFTCEEFLDKFLDPKKTFSDGAKAVSDTYKAHALVNIVNDFLMMKKDYLTKTLAEHNHHFYLAYMKINDGLVHTPVADRKFHRRFMKGKRSKRLPEPKETDEYFCHEYWFTHNELKVEDFVKQKELDRQLKVQDAKDKGELYECSCCFDDECLFEDLANCPEGHLFCKVCVVRSTEAAFGEMKTRFPCLTGMCDQGFALSTLQGVIPANLFSKIVSRLQEEEVLQAEIPDLVTCPFCPFATIMPNPDDKVFKCLNPECLKESCRLCREDNHIPLKCNEVESRAGTRMRTYIENRMAEAVMRKCQECGKRFLKDTGCNKMTCVCGATSCYFCKAHNIDYEHFNQNKKCALTDPAAIHERDMKEAAHKAMEDYLLEHPEAAELDLQSDLKDIIQKYDPEEILDSFNDENSEPEFSTGDDSEEDY